jgi:CRP-like cAMP-binding protein
VLDRNAYCLFTLGFSGIMCGFTGSYIFSQTIFTYRTGIKSRWIGIFVAVAELTVFLLTFNVLEVTPLFFLGGTLIFIGFELLYEWLIEVRHKLLLSEYCVLMATFILIFFLSIDEGIVFGILIAGLDYVVKTARTVSITQLEKRSRAVWNRDEWKFLQLHCYDPRNPKIMTLEVKGSVFFGSSLQLLNQMIQLTGVKKRSENNFKDAATQNPFRSPRRSSPASIKDRRTNNNSPSAIKSGGGSDSISENHVVSPEIVILHLSLMQNLDASAAQGCFLQFARMCGKHGVVVCASGASVRVDWMLRAHQVAYNLGEEDYLKERLLGSMSSIAALDLTKILLFETIYEALEFAEACLLGRARCYTPYINIMGSSTPSNYPNTLLSQYTLSTVFNQYLGLEEKETQLLEQFEAYGGKFHEDMRLSSGDSIFSEGEPADAFYIILAGSVALHQAGSVALKQRSTARSPRPLKSAHKKSLSVPDRGGILSGAGFMPLSKRHSFEEKAEDLGLINQYLQAGAIFGFVDFILDQPRRFGAVAKGRAVVAQISRGDLTNLKAENPELQRIVDKVLLQASIRELSAISEP